MKKRAASKTPAATATRTAAEVRAEFERRGESIKAWAAKNQFGHSLVYEVLAGRKRCLRGKSHRIAVLLGIKDGVIVD